MLAFNSSSDPIYACPEQLHLAQTLYSVSLGLSTVATLFLGYIYDKRGPRFAGVFGALLCAVCFALVTVALKWPHLNALVWLAVPLADCAGGLVSLAMWGFTWHLPEKQATVSSLYMVSAPSWLRAALARACANTSRAQASMSVSFCMAFVATFLVHSKTRVHVSPTYVWLVYSAFALLSAVMIGASAPSSSEFHREASSVTGAESKPPESHICRTSCHVLRAWSRHSARNVLFVIFATLTYCWVGAWASSYVQLVDLTLDAKNGQRMLTLFAFVGGFFSGVVQPVVGYVFDKIGLRLFFAIVNIALLINICLMDTVIPALRPFRIQVIVLMISSFVQSSWAVVILRWNIYFVPPSLNGTAIGVTFAVAGLAQVSVQFRLAMCLALHH
jgi:MFS family permease